MDDRGHSPWEYDVFLSYARLDDSDSGIVTAVGQELTRQFHRISGRPLTVFKDADAITTATIWRDRLELALERSALLIAFVSPSYLASPWCAREFDKFAALEESHRDRFELATYESRIFPITTVPIVLTGGEPVDVEGRHKLLSRRQAIDITSCSPDSSEFRETMERLAKDVDIILRRLGAIRRTTREPEHEVPIVATHTGSDQARMTALLTEADSVTIVGVTNSWLPECLEQALHGRPRFWDRLDIVFLGEEVLPYVNDELSADFPVPAQALKERTRRAGQAKRRIMSLLLREGAAGHWSLHSHPFALPFTGNLFVFRDGRRRVQLGVTRPTRSESDNLRIDFIDRFDQSFEAIFSEIVNASREEHEVILVGSPGRTSDHFLCQSARFRRSILEGGNSTTDWLPAVVAITWRIGPSGPEPLLQLNSPTNSTREMGKVSHVSGYINQLDHSASTGVSSDIAGSFEISWGEAESAVRRELQDDFGITEAPAPQPLTTVPFYYHDKENFVFYLLTQQISKATVFGEHTRMFGWTPADLMRIRQNQLLTRVIEVFDHPMSAEQRRRTLRLLLANLEVHGETETARLVRRYGKLNAAPAELVEAVARRVAATTHHRYVKGTEIRVSGIAGLQYRVFFSHLLPAYVGLGVEGATEILADIRSDESADAIRLARLGWDVDAVEPTAAGVGKIRNFAVDAAAQVSVFQGDVLTWDYPDEGYDLIVCNGVLHYVADKLTACRRLQQATRIGGVNALSLWSDYSPVPACHEIVPTYPDGEYGAVYRSYQSWDKSLLYFERRRAEMGHDDMPEHTHSFVKMLARRTAENAAL
ncbi:SAM-dependent methyltransferase [Actinoplanes tereljensis]|uniref:TIR domain-containing protein n=1 Tax=Paractinoplanes tereljensis TaxID=571912 RepID=A0A919TPR4_9ACTN|nr:TIR domain-containing protein [Actinoplanes tereljensis]GIF17374.1 hypothetical protein Ate02nite_01040 [Actinoplanes tereljensis]